MNSDDIIKQSRNVGSSKKAHVIFGIFKSRDNEEILYRIREVDLANLKFAKTVYECYQRLQANTGTSLNYYCHLLSSFSDSRAPSYFKNWYIIYRHFCIRSHMSIEELIGIDYKKLKFISESRSNVFDYITTQEVITYLKSSLEPEPKKWRYLKDIKERKLKGYSCYDNTIYGIDENSKN